MESFKLSFEAIAPIFIMMFLGYFLKSIKIADISFFDILNKVVFKVFLPVLLFYNIYKTSTPDVFNEKLVVFFLISIAIIFILGYIAVKKLTSDNSRRGVMLQDFFRSNYAILGVPLAGYICGEGSMALASLMVAIVIPVYNVLAVVSLEMFRPGNTRLNIIKLVKGIATNPLIIGSVAGLIFFLLEIRLPDTVEKSVKDLSALSTPLSLIVLGAKFEFSRIKGYGKDIFIITLTRLVIVPLMAIPAAILFGFRNEALACILIIFASPVAVSSFAMAKQMDGDENLAAQAVIVSSALCLVTLFLWIFALSSLGYF